MSAEMALMCGDGTIPPTIDMYPNMFDQDAVGLLPSLVGSLVHACSAVPRACGTSLVHFFETCLSHFEYS